MVIPCVIVDLEIKFKLDSPHNKTPPTKDNSPSDSPRSKKTKRPRKSRYAGNLSPKDSLTPLERKSRIVERLMLHKVFFKEHKKTRRIIFDKLKAMQEQFRKGNICNIVCNAKVY